MPDLNELLGSESAKKLMNDRNAVARLKSAPETRRLMDLLSTQAGGDLQTMADAAAGGQPQQLMGAIQKLLRDPESQKLLGEISQSLKL